MSQMIRGFVLQGRLALVATSSARYCVARSTYCSLVSKRLEKSSFPTCSFSLRRCLASSPGQENEKITRPNDMGTRQKAEYGKNKGPVGWTNLVVTGVVLLVLYLSYEYAKVGCSRRLDCKVVLVPETKLHFCTQAKKDFEKAKERKQQLGKAKIGGSFDLIDHTGQPKKSEDFFGKWILLYFGFTHCPDICPDEMEKMAEVGLDEFYTY